MNLERALSQLEYAALRATGIGNCASADVQSASFVFRLVVNSQTQMHNRTELKHQDDNPSRDELIIRAQEGDVHDATFDDARHQDRSRDRVEGGPPTDTVSRCDHERDERFEPVGFLSEEK